jgi:hypothetical protein
MPSHPSLHLAASMLLLCFFALARATDLGGVGPKDSSLLPRTQKTPSGPAEEEPAAGTTAQNVPATPAPATEDPVPPAPATEDPVPPVPATEDPVPPEPATEDPVPPGPGMEDPLPAMDGTPGPAEVQEQSSVVPAPPGNQTR